jgi:hypothetical protein
MLSVCIPVFQVDVRPLGWSLLEQARALSVPVEIYCLDDASDPAFRTVNRELAGQAMLRYEELPRNLGRARIRNRLARRARFPFLLFLDSDARLARPDFLHRYVERLPTGGVLCGGGIYQAEPPEDSRLWLHWYYGSRMEQWPAARRRKQPYRGFKTFNFLAPRDLLLRLPFDENLEGYGHEDTLWGLSLEREEVPVQHFDNPACHAGLEVVEGFLAKQRAAVKQLHALEKAYPGLPVRLLEVGRRLEQWKLEGMVGSLLKAGMPALERFLTSHRSPASLWALNLYKLGYLLDRKG